MNGLELEFLFFIQFSLHVTPDIFMRYRNELISHTTWTGFEHIQISSATSSQQSQQASAISSTTFAQSSTSTIYDNCVSVPNPVNVVSSTDKPQGREVVTSHAWTQETHTSQISPSPPPSATSVSPTSCDEQDKTEEMLHMDNLKYYSAPARYTCPPPQPFNYSRHRSNSCPLATDKVVTPQYSNPNMDRIASQQQFLPMETYNRIVSQDPFVPGVMNNIRSSNPMNSNTYKMGSRSRTDIVRTSSHERCLSIPISPNTSSPRFMDTIVSSKS